LIRPSEKDTTVSVPLNENISSDVNKIGGMLRATPMESKSQGTPELSCV
jgi:hypothetical protein